LKCEEKARNKCRFFAALRMTTVFQILIREQAVKAKSAGKTNGNGNGKSKKQKATTTAGPSTALLTNCVSNFAQDDRGIAIRMTEDWTKKLVDALFGSGGGNRPRCG
jgi:hypothetical protein